MDTTVAAILTGSGQAALVCGFMLIYRMVKVAFGMLESHLQAFIRLHGGQLPSTKETDAQ